MVLNNYGYKQMILLEWYRIKNGRVTIGKAIELIEKAKHKHGSIFDCKG